MKLFFGIILSMSMLLAIVAVAQSPGDDIAKALGSGNVGEIAKYFDRSVDITLEENSKTYSKSQAQEVLKSFFDQNKISSFKKLHDVSSRGGNSSSFVGQMTAGGKNYRVYVLLTSSNSGQIIQELSIRQR